MGVARFISLSVIILLIAWSALPLVHATSVTWYPPYNAGFFQENLISKSGTSEHLGYAYGTPSNGTLFLWTQGEALGVGAVSSQVFPFTAVSSEYMNAIKQQLIYLENQTYQEMLQAEEHVENITGMYGVFNNSSPPTLLANLTMLGSAPIAFTATSSTVVSVVSNVQWVGYDYAYVIPLEGDGQAEVSVQAILSVFDQTTGQTSMITMNGIPSTWSCSTTLTVCGPEPINTVTSLSASFQATSGHEYQIEVYFVLSEVVVSVGADSFAQLDFYTHSGYGITIQFISFNY